MPALPGCGEQIPQYLPDASNVAPDQYGLRGRVQVAAHAMAAGFRLHCPHGARYQLVGVCQFAVERQLAGVGQRQALQVVYWLAEQEGLVAQ